MTNGVRWSREQAVRTKSNAMPNRAAWGMRREAVNSKHLRRTLHATRRTVLLRDIRPLQSQEIHEEPIRPRHPHRQLAEKAQPRIHVRAATERREEQPARELRRRIRGSRLVRF